MKNLAKMICVVVVSAIVLVSTVAVLTPRVVRAVAAQLVQNIDSPPRNAWTASCSTPTINGYETSCAIPVPAGQVVTIQTVTFSGTTVNHENVLLTLNTWIGGTVAIWHNQFERVVPEPGVPVSIPPVYAFASSANLTLYADTTGNGSVQAIITTEGSQPANPSGAGLSGNITLIGYTVNVGAPSAN